MKKYIKDIAVYSLITAFIYFLWIGLELLLYGEIQTREVDNIIGLILVVSLYANYKQKQIANILIKALVKSTFENLSKESK